MEDQTERDSVKESLLMELAGQIGREWSKLGRFLAIPDSQLEHLARDNPNNQEEVIYKMLLLWKQREGSKATRRDLADALQKAYRTDLAELLQREEDQGIRHQPAHELEAQPSTSAAKPVEPNPKHGDLQSYVNEQGRHNLVIGSKHPTDSTLYHDKIRKYEGFTLYQTHDFTYQKKSNETITAVLVRDNWDDNTGGTAEPLHGGPGHNSVKVRVTSQLTRGMDFEFFVYGRKA